MMWRLLVVAALVAASDHQKSEEQPPVEEVNRAMAAAQAALASAASEKAEAQKELAAAATEKRLTEAKATAEERKIAKAQANLRSKQKEFAGLSDSTRKVEKEKEEDADEKLQRDRKVRKENVGILKDAIANNDKAAQMALEAKKQVDQAHAQVEKVEKAEQQYKQKADEAAAAEKLAQDAKAHADDLTRQRSAELAVLQEEAHVRAKDKAKLLLDIEKVKNSRRAVAAALAEAHKATQVAAEEVSDAGAKKKQAAAEMKKAKNLMEVAQHMHDVAERAMVVAAHVLPNPGTAGTGKSQAQPQPTPSEPAQAPSDPYSQSGWHGDEAERAMEAAVVAASNADARLQRAQQELMKLQDAKAHESERLNEEDRELKRATSSLDHNRATVRRDAAELSAMWDELRILQVLLAVVLAAVGAAAYYGYLRPPVLPEPMPRVVTEEKAVGKSAQSPITQSPVSRPEDFMEAKAETPHFTPQGSPQTTPRLPQSQNPPPPPPPFGLGGAVNIPSLALPAQTGPKRYFMSPRCAKESSEPDMSRQTSPSFDVQSPDVTSKKDKPDVEKLPALPGSGKDQLSQPLLRET